MKTILLLAMWFTTTLAGAAWAQQRTVTGTVTSAENGEPLPGVNVVLEGAAIGTVTDLDGNYTLSVPENGGALVFSFIGLETRRVEIGNQSVINVVLESDVRQLTEVVVTALGIERERRSLGYSVENVTGEQVQQVAEPDALRALQGKVAGVNISGSGGAPGSSTRITIRGNSSLLGNNQPLFVVDGIPYNGEQNSIYAGLTEGTATSSRIADLDPNNIASMTVLKGAAAAALYGSRAANGVVVITTKTGSGTVSRKGMEITLNSSVAAEEIANMPDYQNIYGTGTNFAYQQVNGSWGAPFIGTRPYANIDSIPHWYDGRPGMEEFWGTMVPYRAYPDNVADLFRTGIVVDNSISISGGNENSVLTSVVSRTDHRGYVPNTQFNRTSLSIGGKTILSNNLMINGNLTYSITEQDAVQSGVGSLGSNNPSAFARALYLGRNWDVQGQPHQNPVDKGSEFMIARSQADNPLWSYENAGLRSQNDRINGYLGLGYDLTDWLSLSYKIGMDSYTERQKDYIRPGSTGADGLGRIATYDVGYKEIESNLLLTAQRDLTNNFNLRATLGHNVNQRTFEDQAFEGLEYVVFDIDDMDNINNVVPFGGDYERRRLWGVFADISFGYRDLAFLNLTARNDWSSTLPVDANSFFYPSISGSVILSELLNLESQFLSSLKLRAGWSQVGNDTDPYMLRPVFLINNTYDTSPKPTADMPFRPTGGTTTPGGTLSNIERDPNLKPERTREIEFGADISLFNDRVGVNATYYKRNSFDQIAPVTLPAATGFVELFTNFGEISNEGVELTLEVTPINVQDGFRWNLYGVFTHNRNLVVSLTEGVNEITFGSAFSGSITPTLRPGQEFGLLRGSVDARDDEGNLLIDPSNGQMIPALDPAIVGNPNPDFIFGLTNTFGFKGFTLSAVFDWKQGGDLFSNSVQAMLGRGVTRDTEDREMNKIIPGVYGDPNTREPIRTESAEKIPNRTMIEENTVWFGQTFAINGSDEWSVFDATVFRLREVTLGYILPQTWLERSPFGSIGISLTGRNLWYMAPGFPKYINYDPEVNQYGSDNSQGIEYSATPTTRRYSVNLKVTF